MAILSRSAVLLVVLIALVPFQFNNKNQSRVQHGVEGMSVDGAASDFVDSSNDGSVALPSSNQSLQLPTQQQQQQIVSAATTVPSNAGSSGATTTRPKKTIETYTELQQAVDNYLLVRQRVAVTVSGAAAASAATSGDSQIDAVKQLETALENSQLVQTYGMINEWDVSRIDNFAALFSFRRNALTATYIDGYVDLSQWDVSRATNTQDMFLGCENMDFDFASWNVDRVTKFNGMFEGCTNFQGRGLDTWNVSRGQLFQSMFSRVFNLSPTQFNITSWTPWNAENMNNMFRDSNFGGNTSSTSSDLCGWYQYLPMTATTTDMFLRSQCPVRTDPHQLTSSPIQFNNQDESSQQLQQQPQLTNISFCQPCDPVALTSPPSSLGSNNVQQQAESTTTTTTASSTPSTSNRPNVLFIMSDQQRFDSIRWIQDRLPWYNDKNSMANNLTQFKIDTPNIDSLLKSGAYFDNAYTQCAVCAPARTTLRTGCTIERHGVQENDLYKYYERSDFFEDRVRKLSSIDQLLVEELGYISEYYGKWHIPQSLGESRDGSGRTVISFNDFEYETGNFFFKDDPDSRKIRRHLEYFQDIGSIPSPNVIEEGQQIDPYTKYPYDPISLDSRARYNSLTNTPLSGRFGFDEQDTSEGNVMGLYSLSKDYTPTHFTGDVATRALRRLQNQDNPWFLTLSLHSPHPPFVPSWEFLEKYWDQRSNLHVPRNLMDDLKDSNYASIRDKIPEYGNVDMIQELTAIYYALCEEVDAEVGSILSALEPETAKNTLIVFTSDHGEMLGSHGKRDKSNFYEEASKVPLMFSFPGVIKKGTVIDEKVSHLDVFATILDYVNATELDESDGTSLRPMIENRVINEDRDQDVAFGEWDFRMPTSDESDALTRTLDDRPTNLVRKGSYKLMIHKSSTSDEVDMMFDLSQDPFELDNLIGIKGMSAADEIVSKAEQMRCLLLDWMNRLDGEKRYFSDPANNFLEGEGDIVEIWKRQSWREIGFWVSDTALKFGRMAWDETKKRYIRHEWMYMGTRLPEKVSVVSVEIIGHDSSYFQVDRGAATIEFGDCVPIRVTMSSKDDIPPDRELDAYLVIKAEGRDTKSVRLHGSDKDLHPVAPPPASDVQSRTDPPLESTETPATVQPTTVSTQADGTVSVCHVCPESQCVQLPDEVYPIKNIEVTCKDIEVGGKHLLTPISVKSCTTLQNEMSSGVCGGCGSAGCS